MDERGPCHRGRRPHRLLGIVALLKRVSVVGNSGSGKTTFGRALAAHLAVPFLELDAIRHQAGWQELPDDEFRRRTRDFVAAEAWVVDGNYGVVREDIVWARADTVIWVDPPRLVGMAQIVRRSCGRVLLRRELWNGNRERVGNLFALDPLENVTLWAWTNHGRNQQRYEAAMTDPRWSHLDFRRLRTRRELRDVLSDHP